MSPDEARRAAAQILQEDRFHRRQPPRPFHGVLSWIGDRLAPITRLIDRIEGSQALGIAAAVAVLATATVLALIVIHRRSAAVAGGSERTGRAGRPEDPSDLERRADNADRAGDPELAIRLRFRAGLLRLDEAGVLEYRPSLTTGAAVRAVRSDKLADLARNLEEVVYGQRVARPEDAAEAKDRWPQVLAELRRP